MEIEDRSRMAVVHDTSATLLQCVVITLMGYCSSRMGYLNDQTIRGMELFTSNAALPSLIFYKLSLINLSLIHIPLIAGIFMAKVIILVIVIMTGCCLAGSAWNTIGLYSIFATMCNDFGIALPVLEAIFGSNLADELYLISPLSLCILNPVGIYMMEYQNNKLADDYLELAPSTSSAEGKTSKSPPKKKLLLKVLISTIFHPHVLTSFLAIVVNVSGKGNALPDFLRFTLKSVGDTFCALILFVLGFHLHPKNNKSYKLSVIALSIVKTVALPIFCLLCVRALSGSLTLSNFSFIYGSVPTPPLVTMYATKYHVNPQQISTAVCVSSLMSLPLLFVASKSTALSLAQPLQSDYEQLGFDLSVGIVTLAVFNLICAILVIIYLTLISERYLKLPFHFLLCICISQTFQSLGLLFWHAPNIFLSVYAICFVTSAQLSCRLFLAFFALSVTSSLRDKEGFVTYKRAMTLVGFSVPTGLSLAMYLLAGRDSITSLTLPLFLNGHAEVIIFACALSFCICVVLGSLLDALFQETGIASPVKEMAEKPERRRQKHLLALVCLAGSAMVGLVHTYWRITDTSDGPLLIAIEYLDCYMSFGQAILIMIAYGIHSKYYTRLERIIYAVSKT